MKNSIYTLQHASFGAVAIRPYEDADAAVIHPWVNQAYAAFWLMNGYTQAQVVDFYQRARAEEGIQVFIGEINQEATFLIECYRIQGSALSGFVDAKDNDWGMHFLVAPNDQPKSGFTYCIIETVMHFIFDHYQAGRVVVEPDQNNHKVHRLNRKVGFKHIKPIQLGEKKALLAVCDKAAFERAVQLNNKEYDASQLKRQEITNPSSLAPGIWDSVNRHLVGKMLSEFTHERLLSPQIVADQDNTYQLSTMDDRFTYRFRAKLMQLNHWCIDAKSIKKTHNNQVIALDAVAFVMEFHQQLGLSDRVLPTYLEEIASTLMSQGRKLARPSLSANELVHADFQAIEAAMFEGHPSFIANNGRIGFDRSDYWQYAPEMNQSIHYYWLAIAKKRSVFVAFPDLDYAKLMAMELDVSTQQVFNQVLTSKDLEPSDYWFIPVHPWQWDNKLHYLFMAELAHKEIVFLGQGDDHYQAQQSIRTLYNLSHPKKHYVKTALSILNMGFMRGLSADYMEKTPGINEWVYELIQNDGFLQDCNFHMLRELAAIGFRNELAQSGVMQDNPYRKLLAALWRESPDALIQEQQKVMTMAALLHVDDKNQAFLRHLIAQSELSVEAWLKQYFGVYLLPLLHCFYQHKLVFMPHGENIILIMENYAPVGVFMKDIGEEVCLLNLDQAPPERVARIACTMPDDVAILSIFTDVFVGIFRYLSAILDQHLSFSEVRFWRLVADTVHDYQRAHPDLQASFERYDLFASNFKHSCLNRLQLNNNKQMVDLSDPAESLQFVGELSNPIAPFRFADNSQDRKLA